MDLLLENKDILYHKANTIDLNMSEFHSAITEGMSCKQFPDPAICLVSRKEK